MRYYLLFMVTFLVACGGSDFLPEADILVPDVIGSDQSDSDTALRRDTPAEDRGQSDEGDDEGVDLIPDEGQDVTDAREDTAEDVPVEDPGTDEGEDAQEDTGEDVGGDEGAVPDEGSDPGAEDVGTDAVVYGAGNCYDLWRCYFSCTEGEICPDACLAQADEEALGLFSAAVECIVEACNCPSCSDAWIAECYYSASTNPKSSCYPAVQSCLADTD